MKITKGQISNFFFLVLIGLLLYPPTKVYLIRLISFSPTAIEKNEQERITNYNWSLRGLNTASVNFNDYKDKVVLVNFWATWCPPCVAEMPSLKDLHKDYKDKIDFLLISNEKWKVIDEFYKENNYNFLTYSNASNPPKELQVSSIPATFIIDKKGNIVMNKNGAANWNSSDVRNLLDKLLKE